MERDASSVETSQNRRFFFGGSVEDDDVVEHELGERLSIDRENVAIDAVSIELGIRVV